MTEQTAGKDAPLEMGHWPLWKKIAVLFLAVTTLLALLGTFVQAYQLYVDSPKARELKAQIKPLAEQLERIQKVGDKQAAFALSQPTVKILNDFNGLDEAKKEEIKNTQLRYCMLAAVHLSSGVVEVMETGDWASKSKYEAALDTCK